MSNKGNQSIPQKSKLSKSKASENSLKDEPLEEIPEVALGTICCNLKILMPFLYMNSLKILSTQFTMIILKRLMPCCIMHWDLWISFALVQLLQNGMILFHF